MVKKNNIKTKKNKKKATSSVVEKKIKKNAKKKKDKSSKSVTTNAKSLNNVNIEEEQAHEVLKSSQNEESEVEQAVEFEQVDKVEGEVFTDKRTRHCEIERKDPDVKDNKNIKNTDKDSINETSHLQNLSDTIESQVSETIFSLDNNKAQIFISDEMSNDKITKKNNKKRKLDSENEIDKTLKDKQEINHQAQSLVEEIYKTNNNDDIECSKVDQTTKIQVASATECQKIESNGQPSVTNHKKKRKINENRTQKSTNALKYQKNITIKNKPNNILPNDSTIENAESFYAGAKSKVESSIAYSNDLDSNHNISMLQKEQIQNVQVNELGTFKQNTESSIERNSDNLLRKSDTSTTKKINYKELKAIYDKIKCNIRYDDNIKDPYEKKREKFNHGIYGLDEFSEVLFQNIVNDISLELLGPCNIFLPTKSIVIYAPDGYGKKQLVEQFCRHYSINLMEFFPYTMKRGMLENLLQFVYKTREKTIIFFDNCQTWLSQRNMSANNMLIGELLNLLCNKRYLNELSKKITFIFSTTEPPNQFIQEFHNIQPIYCSFTLLTDKQKLQQVKDFFNEKYQYIGLNCDSVDTKCYDKMMEMFKYVDNPGEINKFCENLLQLKKITITTENILACRKKMDDWRDKQNKLLNTRENFSTETQNIQSICTFEIDDTDNETSFKNIMTLSEKLEVFSLMIITEKDVDYFRNKMFSSTMFTLNNLSQRQMQQQKHELNMFQQQQQLQTQIHLGKMTTPKR